MFYVVLEIIISVNCLLDHNTLLRSKNNSDLNFIDGMFQTVTCKPRDSLPTHENCVHVCPETQILFTYRL